MLDQNACISSTFSALTLFVWQQEGYPACKTRKPS